MGCHQPDWGRLKLAQLVHLTGEQRRHGLPPAHCDPVLSYFDSEEVFDADALTSVMPAWHVTKASFSSYC